jgi:hypothetical protein
LKILADRLYHSPEVSETDEEDPEKSIIAIYDYSWRSDEVWRSELNFIYFCFSEILMYSSNFVYLLIFQLKNILRNVLDSHSAQKVRLVRERKYDDEIQRYDRPHPANAPEWSYVEQQDLLYDTEIDQRRPEEEYAAEYEEVEVEVHRGTTPATEENNNTDSEYLEMDG